MPNITFFMPRLYYLFVRDDDTIAGIIEKIHSLGYRPLLQAELSTKITRRECTMALINRRASEPT